MYNNEIFTRALRNSIDFEVTRNSPIATTTFVSTGHTVYTVPGAHTAAAVTFVADRLDPERLKIEKMSGEEQEKKKKKKSQTHTHTGNPFITIFYGSRAAAAAATANTMRVKTVKGLSEPDKFGEKTGYGAARPPLVLLPPRAK